MRSTNMHKCSRVVCSQFESHSTHKMDSVSLNQSITKRGLESVFKAQNMYESQQNQQPPKMEANGYL
jgi:hypothetical protein